MKENGGGIEKKEILAGIKQADGDLVNEDWGEDCAHRVGDGEGQGEEAETPEAEE